GSHNYASFTDDSQEVVISPAHLTVVADDQSKTYDRSAFTGFTARLTGFVNGEDADTAQVTGAASFGGDDVGAVKAGSYALPPGPGPLSAPDYDFNAFPPGPLTVLKRAITVTADAQAKGYGDPDPILTYSITAGSLADGDSLGGRLLRSKGE